MASDDESGQRVNSICSGMERYYRSLNREYDSNFSNYFDENGYDEDTIEEDYTQGDPLNILSIDFCKDEDDKFDFPFGSKRLSTELKQAVFIWDLIKQIDANPKIQFDPTAPDYDEEYFKVNDKEINEIREKYKAQCPAIFYSGLSSDMGMLYVLAVTEKHGNDYILHLVDDFSRHRVKFITNKQYTETNWTSDGHLHFKKTKDIKTPFASQKDKSLANLPGNYADLIQASVRSFGKRCCSHLMLNNTKLINDSLKDVVSYISAAITFIKGIIITANKENKAVCPFIFDFSLSTGAPIIKNQDEKDDSDDDEPDETNQEDEKEFVDLIGDIGGKLKKNNLKHVMSGYNFDNPPQPDRIDRLFTKSFNKLKGNKVKDEKAVSYLHKKRFVTMIDRRKSKNNEEVADSVWMYEPTVSKKYTYNIPDDAVSLWPISASKTYLLPNMNYNEKDATGEPDANKLNDDEKDKDPKDQNIGATHHCKCGLLTLSFVVKKENVIKCYLFYGGGVIRFFPVDIKTVLPTIFNMDYGGNKDYIENDKDLDHLIRDMTDKFVDDEFSKFQQNY